MRGDAKSFDKLMTGLAKKVKPDSSKTFYPSTTPQTAAAPLRAGSGMYEVDKTSGGTVTKIAVYYPVGGAMRINGTLYFILKDQLGSASVVTDASGTTVGEDRFYPYGETRFTTGTMYTDKLYTGQREMTGLGIYHYGARFYSPKLGRFLSPDTIVPGAANPQAYNRYSYVLGNPLKYSDPTGHMQASDVYTESDGECDPGDTSCNWVGTSNDNGKGDKEKSENTNDLPVFGPPVLPEYWSYSHSFTAGIHLGPTAQVHFPDYNDDSYNGWPWVSGPYNEDVNFSIAVDVYYNELTGTHISNVQWENRYDGAVILNSVDINNRTIFPDPSYLPSDGAWRPIPQTSGDWDNDTAISINIDVAFIANAGQGPVPVNMNVSLQIPSLNQIMTAMGFP